MSEIDLLRALPKVKRNIQKRKDAKDPAVVAVSRQFGEMYFDGPRDYGYGGYRYEAAGCRWRATSSRISGCGPACACSMSAAPRVFWSGI